MSALSVFLALFVALSVGAATSAAQRRPPVLDMHMHAREAAHYGATGLPICAPVSRMPRWDPRTPFGDDPTAPAGAPLRLLPVDTLRASRRYAYAQREETVNDDRFARAIVGASPTRASPARAHPMQASPGHQRPARARQTTAWIRS